MAGAGVSGATISPVKTSGSGSGRAVVNCPVALVALANLDELDVRSDVIIASTVNLTDGSGFSADPLACHANPPRGGGSGWVVRLVTLPK